MDNNAIAFKDRKAADKTSGSGNSIKPFHCKICNQGFVRKDGLKRHSMRFHSELPISYECLCCGLVFKQFDKLQIHRKIHSSASKFEKVASGLKGVAKNFRYKKSFDEANVKKIQSEVTSPMIDTINNELNEMLRAKINIVFSTILARLNEFGETISTVEYLIRSTHVEVFRYSDHRESLQKCFDEIQQRVDDYNENGSAFFLAGVEYVGLEFSECRPLGGECGDLSVTYKKQLEVLKVEDQDGQCFYRALGAFFVETEDKHKIDSFLERNVKMMPVGENGFEVKDIDKFEEMNSHLDFKINLVYKEKQRFFPIRLSKRKAGKIITLMLIKLYRSRRQSSFHYVLVKDLSKLVRKTYDDGSYENVEVCHNCFSKFSRKSTLADHQENCFSNNPQKILLAQPGEKIEFMHKMKKYRAPFVGFMDMETINKKVDKCISPDCSRDSSCTHKSQVIAEQEPVSFCMIFLDHAEKIIFRKTYAGKDCMNEFQATLIEAWNLINEKIENRKTTLKMSNADEKKFQNATECHICEEAFMKDAPRESNQEFSSRETVLRSSSSSATHYLDLPDLDGNVAAEVEIDPDPEIPEKIVRDHCHFAGK